MTSPRIFSLFLVTTGLWAANINITVTGVTPTQAVVSYSAKSGSACTLALSESQAMKPLVNDVNPAIFPGASSDSRPGSISNGVARTVVLGKRAIEKGADGKNYSRALQAYTQHFLSVTCGADSGTAVFRTQNPPLGNNAPDVPLFDPTAFGNYAQPTIDFSNQAATYIDPLTGILLKIAALPMLGLDPDFQNRPFSQVVDANSAWTSAASVISDSAAASYGGAGTTSDSLFLQASLAYPGGRGYSTPYSIVDLRLHITGKGTGSAADRTMSACLSTDRGQTCAGAIVDLPALPSGSAGAVQFPATYPSPILSQWTAPGTAPVIMPDFVTRSGSVTVTGNLVALTGGDTFQNMAPGDVITMPGAGCPNGDQCVIASVINSSHLKLKSTVPGTVTANFTAGNSGFKIWKKTASGTVSISSARFDIAHDAGMGMPVEGGQDHCSNVLAITTADRNGAPLSGPQSGFLCTQEDIQWDNARLFWYGTNGEVRHISDLYRPQVNSPAADAVSASGNVCATSGNDPVGNFDPTDANSLYCAGNKTGNNQYDVLYKCTYNPKDPAWGNYREWTGSGENPAESCVNITKASLGNDLKTQIQALAPSFSSSRYSIGAGNVSGKYMSMFARTGQNGMGYFIRFDLSTGRVVMVHDSWSTPPVRWGAMHAGAGEGPQDYGGILIIPLRAPSDSGAGQFQLSIQSIDGLPTTALTDTYADSKTCEQLGVTDPAFISTGATGKNCIAVTTTGEPYDPTPAASELALYPHPNNSQACGGDGSTANCWTKLQDSMEGDYMLDSANDGSREQFRIVKKISPSRLILQRGASVSDCSSVKENAHAAQWIPIMWNKGSCGGAGYVFDTHGNVLIESASMSCCHQDALYDDSSDYVVKVQSNYDIRTGPQGQQLGQPATFHSYGSYVPTFAGSTAGIQPGWALQSHPTARQHVALPAERRWILDGRPYGGANGGSNVLFYNVVTPTAVTDVYKVGPALGSPGGGALSGMDRKRLPLQVWAGRYQLADKSGPGSVLAATDRWNYCVADFAGECMPGSAAGDVYMNVPQADTSGVCTSQFETNTPCWASSSPVAPFITQVGIDRPDPTGNYWRRISNFFNGMGWSPGFFNAGVLPDASWAFTDATWLNGARTTMMVAKLPPWPQEDAIQRGTFIPVGIQINGTAQRSYRVRFGYDTNLFCTTRQEQCATVASGSTPFLWVSEKQSWQNCTGPCEIKIPAISGRVLYYVVDASDAKGNVASTGLNAYPVP